MQTPATTGKPAVSPKPAAVTETPTTPDIPATALVAAEKAATAAAPTGMQTPAETGKPAVSPATEPSAPLLHPSESVVAVRPHPGMAGTREICPELPPGDRKPAPPALKTVVIEFASDSAVLRRKYRFVARELAMFLKKNRSTTVVIEGHADYLLSPDYNVGLSRRRAETVKNYLVSKGAVDPARITIQPYGCTQPIADNRTIPGRQTNRRAVTRVNVLPQ
jgi:outer membrane protein OmpA-like peptidoglycan-associated protein